VLGNDCKKFLKKKENNMKKSILILAALTLTSSAFARGANDDPTITDLPRGIICQKISKKYPELQETEEKKFWVVCRSEATFEKVEDGMLSVEMKLSDSRILRCSAELKKTGGKNPIAEVDCEFK